MTTGKASDFEILFSRENVAKLPIANCLPFASLGEQHAA